MTPKADPIVKELTSQLDGDKIDGEQKVQISQALAYILREKGKVIQEAMSKQVYTVLTSVIEERKDTLNDKIITNASVALGFLSAYSSDPARMKDLFYAYDEDGPGGRGDYRVSLGIKLGILMNGSDKVPEKDKLTQDAVNYIGLALNSESGVIEIDGRDISEGRPDEEIFRFDGALDTLGHILSTHLRRFGKSDSPLSKLLFQSISSAGILKKLNEEEDFSGMTKVYDQIPNFISMLPIPAINSKDKISDEMAEVMRDSFTFIHKFFLEFDRKSDGKAALLNLLQLTYNNTLDLSVSTKKNEITPLSNSYIRDTVCEGQQLQGIIPEDMKMICNDIIFEVNE